MQSGASGTGTVGHPRRSRRWAGAWLLRARSPFIGGLALLVLGALMDAAHHLAAPGFAAEGAAGAGHLVTLAGMLVVAATIARAGLRRRR